MTTNEIALSVLSGDADILELWEAVRRFAYGRACRCIQAAKGNGGAEVEDLLQCAFLALLEALEAWRPEAGSFITAYGFHLQAAYMAATWQRKSRDKLDPLESAVSLDSPLPGNEDSTLADVIPDPAAEFDEVAEADFMQKQSEAIRHALFTLDPIMRKVVVFRHMYGMTILQTAAKMGITRGKVCFSEQKALRLLRKSRILSEIHTI